MTHDEKRSYTNTVRHKSVCTRVKMGAVIISLETGEVIGEGVNNGSSKACLNDGLTNEYIQHAEACALSSIVFSGATAEMIVSHYPCIDCSKKIVENGSIKRVYCKRPFKNTDGIKYLQDNGIQVTYDDFTMDDLHVMPDYILFMKEDTSAINGVVTDIHNMTPTAKCFVLKSGDDRFIEGETFFVEMASTQWMTIDRAGNTVLVAHPKDIILKEKTDA